MPGALLSAPPGLPPLSREGQPLFAEAEVADLRARIDQRIAEQMAAERSEYLHQPLFATLYDDLTDFVCRPGKRLRALLFLLAQRVFATTARGGGTGVAEADLLGVAVSLEFLHGFILIHDDIIDRAETRRALPTLHRLIESRLPSFTDHQRAGRNLALVLGDILFALAQKSLWQTSLPADVRTRLSTHLLGCIVETGFGEVADILHGTRDVAKVSLADIEQMYLLKTTRYTVQCPLTMAAILAGASPAQIEALGRIATPAGLAFQIQNDLQEFARFEVSDAEVPADILEGKKTLLMRTAFDQLSQPDQSLLQLCFSAGAATEATVSKARELIAKSGAVAQLSERMAALLAQAEAEVRQTDFPPVTQAGLIGLIHLVREAAARC
jgi:geranylgeranyl diphosphate synthase type I